MKGLKSGLGNRSMVTISLKEMAKPDDEAAAEKEKNRRWAEMMKHRRWAEMMFAQELQKKVPKPVKNKKRKPKKPKAVEPVVTPADPITPGKRRFNFELKVDSSSTPSTG